MSFLKKIISSTYPLRMAFSKATGLGINAEENLNQIKAPVSFYSLNATANTGEVISFEKFRGRKILLVNLASKCGFTPQYEELEKLHRQDSNISVLGFPSNDFGAQEPGSDQDIAQFCKINYGVTFPIFKKDKVKGNDRQEVYQWLSDATKNGWNSQAPEWNFYKYLVNENGDLLKLYSSSVVPQDMAW